MSVPLIFDDAAVFPPGNLPLAAAVDAHRAHGDALYRHLVGPLVVANTDLSALIDLVATEPLDVAVVVPDAAAAAATLTQARTWTALRLVALEVSDTDLDTLRSAMGEPAGVTVYLELPRDERRSALIAALAGTSYRAKLRAGGTTAAAYPDEAELAEAVVALVRARVRFKATAGLHHAVRNTDPETGFEQHGFLNLLAATQAAATGAGTSEVAAILAERDPHRLRTPSEESLFGSVGTCDLADPVTELAELDLLILEETR